MSKSAPQNIFNSARALVFFTALALTQSACGVLLGNVKPVDEKSEAYGIMDISKVKPDWVKLQAPNNTKADSENTVTEIPDAAYQSKATASIISINSACRPGDTQERDLRKLTDLLFLGISNITLREEVATTVEGAPALQTTLRGSLNNEEMMLRTIVFRRNQCLYDLVYMARPDQFPNQETDFSQFVASLRLK